MPFTWKLVGDDLVIRNGTFQTVAGYLEVKQRLLLALRHFYQEYFLNVPGGVPWYELILGSRDKKRAELILRRYSLDVPGVVSILEFSSKFSSTNPRHLDIYGLFEVLDVDGTYVRVPISLTVSGDEESGVEFS